MIKGHNIYNNNSIKNFHNSFNKTIKTIIIIKRMKIFNKMMNFKIRNLYNIWEILMTFLIFKIQTTMLILIIMMVIKMVIYKILLIIIVIVIIMKV